MPIDESIKPDPNNVKANQSKVIKTTKPPSLAQSPKVSNLNTKQKRSVSLQSDGLTMDQSESSPNQVDDIFQTKITISPEPIVLPSSNSNQKSSSVSLSSNMKDTISIFPTVLTKQMPQNLPQVNFQLQSIPTADLQQQHSDSSVPIVSKNVSNKINKRSEQKNILDSARKPDEFRAVPPGPPPSPPITSSSSSEPFSNRTISISDPDLYYLSLPPVKISSHPHGNALSIEPNTESSSKPISQSNQTRTSSFNRQKSTSGHSEQMITKDLPYSTIRSIRFEQQKQKATSKSMRTLSPTTSPTKTSTPKHHQSAFYNIKLTPETAILSSGSTGIKQQQSRDSFRKSMRWKSTNLSQMRLTCHSDTDISDTGTMEINNNYLDNNNTSDNEAMAILPIEARELLMQEEEERKSRLAKESTSLLRIPGLGARRESKYFPGRIRKRVILKNGNINLCPEHVDKRSRRYLQDTFTTMVDIRWRWNLLVFSMGFLGSWFGFSIIWWLIAFSHSDFEHLHDEEWTPCVMNLRNFASALLFSIETQHTIGYGSRFTTEECPEAMFVMMLQSITGVMIQCFMVGFVFAKLSRPQKRSQTLIFSRYAIVNTRDRKLCLMFRVGDLRDRSHIIGAKISAQVIRKKLTEEGEMIPYFHQKLSVKFDAIEDEVFLIWPAIIVHVIDHSSPFYTMNVDDMAREKFEIIAILEGTVESTGQTGKYSFVQARTSYIPSEILWGHRFEQLIRYRHDSGEYLVDYSKFNNTFDVDTPLCSAKELEEEIKLQQQEQPSDEEEIENL